MAATTTNRRLLGDDAGEGIADRTRPWGGTLQGASYPSPGEGGGDDTGPMPGAVSGSAAVERFRAGAQVFDPSSAFGGVPYYSGRVRVPELEPAPVATSPVSLVTFTATPRFGARSAMSTYGSSSAYAGGSVLSQVLGALTTVSGEARSWFTLTGQQELERARVNADTTVKLAAIKAGAVPSVYLGAGGGNVLGQVGAWLPWLVLIFGGMAVIKAMR